eukprot:TRINITY_DN72293_c0_g1_i1.p1 TRINITY_DN72293_c0_g1~~TRINITY_DN72293_c0_g1_i1.p1  ORF type:complete len:226 (+),score=56.09 TRINITY_DN72293_c0_g1_i1:72-680(+)
MVSLPEDTFATWRRMPKDIKALVAEFCGGWRGMLRSEAHAVYEAWVSDTVSRVRMELKQSCAFLVSRVDLYGNMSNDVQIARLQREIPEATLMLATACHYDSAEFLIFVLLRPELSAQQFVDGALTSAQWGRFTYYMSVDLSVNYVTKCALPGGTETRWATLPQHLGPAFADAADKELKQLACHGAEVEATSEGVHLSVDYR